MLEWTGSGVLLIPTVRAPRGGFLDQRDQAQQFVGDGALTDLAGHLLKEMM